MKVFQQNLMTALLAFLLTAATVPALAAGVDLVGDDTDLFTTNPSIPAEVPNVLVVLDNTSNWSQQAQQWPATLDPACVSAGMTGTAQGDAEICAIFLTIQNLTSSVNVGLMMFDDQNKGAYVRFPMGSMTPANIATFKSILVNISTNNPGDKTSSNTAYENPMNDVFRYFNSLATLTQNAAPTPQANVGGYTDSTMNNFSFLPGQSGDTCGFDYIIFIGNGFPNAGSLTPDMATASGLLNDSANIVLNTTPIQNTGSNADVWSRFLFQYGVKVGAGAYRHVTTYTINVCNAKCTANQTALNQITLLQSMATVSQGKYFLATSIGAIESALASIFAEVQAVNSVFAATTLPVSINVRGTNLNQVYIGVFRPDPTSSPRWFGNLKQYQLGLNASTNSLQLVDATGAQAVNLNTGFITNTATSFWTTTYNAQGTTPALGFWSFRGPSYATTDVGKDQDSPDGDLVEKGGGAEMIRMTYPMPDSTAAQTRNLYTCTGSCAAGSTLSSYLFNTSNSDITAALLGTFQAISVSSLSASGTTATAVTSAAHGFSVGNVVTIAGAVPNLFNGNYTIVTVPNATSFTYTLSSAPDTTHAYVTLPGYTLVPATDLVTVSGATPTAYNVASTAISAVVGNANQFSYVLGSSPTTAASGYSVTGIRQVQVSSGTSKVTWSNGSALNNVTVSLANHGYSSADTVAITGATDAAFNTAGSTIVKVDNNTFTYTTASTPAGGTTTTGVVTLTGSLPSGWGSGTVVKISGVTNQTNYNTASTGTSISHVSGNTFQYTTSGTVASAASGTMVANQVVASDTSTWTVSSAAAQSVTATANLDSTWNISNVVASGSGSNQNLSITLNKAQFTDVVSGKPNVLRQLQVGDAISIAGTCTYKVGSATNQCNGLSILSVSGNTANATNPNSTSFTNLNTSVTVVLSVGANIGTISFSGATMLYAGTSSATGNFGIRFTLSRGQYSGQLLHQLAPGDSLAFANCSYTAGGVSNICSGTVAAVSGNSSITNAPPVAANTYADITGTVTVDVVQSSPGAISAVTTTNTAAGVAPLGTATTLAWTGQTIGANVAITSIVPGPLTVQAAGTIYASKSGDLTSKVTSIANQSVATGTITAGLASNPDPNERAELINWVRGQDNKDDENINGISTDVRSSVHGDVLHSRPAVVNYNRFGDNNDVYIFYGSNDGLLRAIKGGQATDGTAGQEQWAFIAPEFFGKVKRLRNQTPAISSTSPKDYFFDGPIGVYTLDANNDGKLNAADGDKVYLFLAMRRGGRMVYALDVTNPTSPKLLWKHGCTNPTGTGSTGGCDTGWDQLGQTWSQPQLAYLNAFPTTLALIFGAGYDSPAEDFQPCVVTAFNSGSVTGLTNVVFPIPMTTANCPPTGGTSTTNNRTMGRGIFIVNAATGAILQRIGPDSSANLQVTGMTYAIPADLAILKNRANTSARASSIGTESVTAGYIDRIYAPDTGGNVWRIDVSDSNTANWVATQFASIAPASGSSTTTGSPAAANMRKLEFQSDVVYSSDANGSFDAVLVGSGDREHPFDQVVANRFYMLKDRNVATITPAMVTPTPPATITESGLFDITNGCLQSATNCTGSQTQATAAASLLGASGWLMQLANTGEKTIAPATTANGTVIFNTNQPKQDTVTGTANNTTSGAGNSCVSDLGTARQYGVSFLNGNPSYIYNQLPSQYVPTSGLGRYATFAGGGFLPQPVPAVVQIGGKYYQTIISGVTTTNPGGLSLQNRVRTYWYKKVD
ncbi:MAG TPA: hypothetical protein VKS43_04625 [Burkholderiales bacterium]|nr:hypothetical protein [Burkholderiales bacterium]